ncbi:MAG: DUF2520 domain-containing protein [Flavobacteriaceae bacterium]|nr:DUF2520 domain-containing protein [Flavobacteriaceae bacterium]
MIKMVLIGTGNVANHLYKAFETSKEASFIQVFGRNKKALKSFSKKTATSDSLTKIKEADVYIIAISDDAITSFTEKLPFKNRLVVHTSGTVAMNVLSDKNRKGVFYPLQTFTKNRVVDFSNIPLCIESENASDLKLLQRIGASISEKVEEINSEERKKVHVSAVIVNNFVNHLYFIGSDLLEKNNLSFDLLKPLIFETALKMESHQPKDAQTGPAKRNDLKTIENHLNQLEESPYKDLYIQLTKSIIDTHGEKL